MAVAMDNIAGKYMLMVNGENNAASATMATITAFCFREYIEYAGSPAPVVCRLKASPPFSYTTVSIWFAGTQNTFPLSSLAAVADTSPSDSSGVECIEGDRLIQSRA